MRAVLSAMAPHVRRLDHSLGRLGGRRQVLFEIRTPMNLAVLRPMLERLIVDPRVRVWITGEGNGPPLEGSDAELVERHWISREEAQWTRFDLYVNADPWNPARLHRCRRRMNLFHGVAGKYDLDDPSSLPLDFGRYDQVAFINEDRRQRYITAGVVTTAQAVLVGFPKIDTLVAGRLDTERLRRSLRLIPSRRTVVYGPTFSPASSLHLAGEAIVETLLALDLNVIVKLHDRSLVPSPHYTAGIDWRGRFDRWRDTPGFVLADGPDSSPYLAVADLLVTDHSSIGFEFCALDRPIIVYDAPDLVHAARINPEKVSLLRSAAEVVRDVSELASAVRRVLVNDTRSPVRRAIARQMFHEPGTATDRAMEVIYRLLDLSPLPSSRPAGARPAGARTEPAARDDEEKEDAAHALVGRHRHA